MKPQLLALFIYTLLQPAQAYYGWPPGGLLQYLERSPLVVVGTVTGPLDGHPELPPVFGVSTRGHRPFSLAIEAIYKGVPGTNQVTFWDSVIFTSHNTVLKSGQRYVMCFWNGYDGKAPFLVQWAAPWNAETKPALESVITQYQDYFKCTTREDKACWLVGHLGNPSKYLDSFIYREIMAQKVTEAVPHYRHMIGMASEADQLRAEEMLLLLKDHQTADQLVLWLKDPNWKDKHGVLLMLQKRQDPKLIPVFRGLVNDANPLLAVIARTALFEFGEPDGKALLFDTLVTSTNAIARINAIHPLHWKYHGDFTADELKILSELQKHSEESVSRVAGFILEKQKPRPK